MIALISPAKGMRAEVDPSAANNPLTEPRFMVQTHHIASLMLRYTAQELESIFKISSTLARELRARFISFNDKSQCPIAAIDCYDGVVYKHFKEGLTAEDREFLQQNMRISSLLYGLLRPLDMIVPYRMEGFVRLADTDQKVENYWRDYQTQTLIDDVQQAGGTLLYLASKQEQSAFDWRTVKRAVRVIDFKFLQYQGEKLRQVVIYTKMARGEMIRYIAQNRVTDPELLKDFEWGGYRYNDTLSSDNEWVWVME